MKTFFINHGFMATVVIAQEVSKTDPYHQKTGGYGYLIGEDRDCSVWWTEAAYKVLRDTPIPKNKDGEIKIWSAKNEYESFILVVKPATRMENFRITIPNLKDGEGNTIDNSNITIRKVEYVHVKPTDSYGFAGWWRSAPSLRTARNHLSRRKSTFLDYCESAFGCICGRLLRKYAAQLR